MLQETVLTLDLKTGISISESLLKLSFATPPTQLRSRQNASQDG